MTVYTIDVLQYLQGTEAKSYPIFLRDGELDTTQLNDEQVTILNNALKSYNQLDISKRQACSRIDATAEALRQGVLTPGAGQAIEYQKTCAEAAAVIALAANGTTTVTVGTYKYLEAEQSALAATTGTLTLLQVAQAIQADVAATDAALAAIKRVRRTAKIKINAATDATGVAAAEAAVVWPDKR